MRPLRQDDCELLFQWRNSPRIRKISLNSNLISVEEHEDWLKKALVAQPPILMVFEFAKQISGVVQFKRAQDSNIFWSFYLGRTDLPAKTGTALCHLGLNWGFLENKYDQIFADVGETNSASLNLHKKLGFMPLGKSETASFSRFVLQSHDWRRVSPSIEEEVFSHE